MSSGDFNYVEIYEDIMPAADDLPGALRDVAEIAGVPLTLQLAQRFRGANVYFHNIDHILRKQRNIDIRKSYDDGVPVDRLSRKYKISVRQIRNILGSID